MLKCQQPAIEAGVSGVRGVESRALGAHQAIGTGRQGRHVKGFSGETSPSVVSKYQGGGEHVHQRMSQGAGTEVMPGPALDNVLGLFFAGTLLSCPQGGRLCHLCLCCWREVSRSFTLWRPAPAPQRSVKASPQNLAWAVIPVCPVRAREPGLPYPLRPSALAEPGASCPLL